MHYFRILTWATIFVITARLNAFSFYYLDLFGNFPYGSRQNAMGSTGTALADDATALYYNPAGLSKDNDRFKSGAFSMTHDRMLPEGNRKLQTANYSMIYKPEKESVGGFGLSFSRTDSPWEKNNEVEIGLSHSFNLKFWNLDKHYFGYSLKYLYRNINFELYNDQEWNDYGNIPDKVVSRKVSGHANTFAIDLGYIFDISPEFHLGLTAKNIGPDTKIPVTKDNLYLPTSFNAAIAYTDKFNAFKKRKLIINGEVRMEREFWGSVKDELRYLTLKENLQRVIFHQGVEVGIEELGFLRCGHLYDHIRLRSEFRYGFGVMLLDHICLDFYKTIAPASDKNTGITDGQWGVTLSCNGILNWIRDGK